MLDDIALHLTLYIDLAYAPYKLMKKLLLLFLLLGLSYKSNCGDIRNSQLISLVENMTMRNMEITIVDPKVNNQDLINKELEKFDLKLDSRHEHTHAAGSPSTARVDAT